MKRYYCEYSHQSINHITPSLNVIEREFAKKKTTPHRILDLGCGNGRNSYYLARKYGSDVILVDIDKDMLDWAETVFSNQGLASRRVCLRIEELVVDPSILPKFVEDTNDEKFDLIILSYVLQHIDPVYYPSIFDFCEKAAKSVIIDIFWNPARIRPYEFCRIGTVDWYGLIYDDLVIHLANRFRLVGSRVIHNDSSVIFNLALTKGKSGITDFIRDKYHYSSHQTQRISYCRTRKSPITVRLDELSCFKLLNSLYPSELDLVQTEMKYWLETDKEITSEKMAAKFLLTCRANKIPAIFDEVARDFEVSPKRLFRIVSDHDYLPPLNTGEYVDRLSRQLGLSESLRNEAIRIIDANLVGCNPAIRACCALLQAAHRNFNDLNISKLATAANVTSQGIRQVLRRCT